MTPPRDPFEYFMSETNRRLELIESKVDLLIEHKMYILGQARAWAVVIGVLISAIAEAFKRWVL